MGLDRSIFFTGFKPAAVWLVLSGGAVVHAQDARPAPAAGQAAAVEVAVPMPPDAPADFSGIAIKPQPPSGFVAELPPPAPADFTNASLALPPVSVELPPEAPLFVDPAITPLGLALRAAIEALPLEAAGKSPAARAAADFNRAIADFYKARDYKPLWIDGSDWNRAAASVLTRLQRAGEDGLDLSAQRLPVLKADSDLASRAGAELAMSRMVAVYGAQASGGRVVPTVVSRLITAKPPTAEAGAVLAAVAASSDPAGTLHEFNPPHEGYKALRSKLAELRNARGDEPVAIGPGRILRVGMDDPRVPLIRTRFNLGPSPEGRDTLYDTQVAGAVADFQKSKGMRADGRLTPQTIAALSGGQPAQLEAEIIANMERWRWLPRDLGRMHMLVNIPEYMVRVVKDGEEIHSARAIVGKTETPTPVFSDAMKFMVVNPSWYVPPSIIKKSSLESFARQGYEVRQTRSGLMVRQPPGPKNALGNVKFMFPNNHAVYLHDTPGRHLFNASLRAFSHGCVRVQNPFKLAEVVMSTAPGWSERRLASLVGRGEQTVHLPQHLPIHLVYFTTFVDENGQLQTRNDLYGFSRRLRTAMGLRG